MPEKQYCFFFCLTIFLFINYSCKQNSKDESFEESNYLTILKAIHSTDISINIDQYSGWERVYFAMSKPRDSTLHADLNKEQIFFLSKYQRCIELKDSLFLYHGEKELIELKENFTKTDIPRPIEMEVIPLHLEFLHQQRNAYHDILSIVHKTLEGPFLKSGKIGSYYQIRLLVYQSIAERELGMIRKSFSSGHFAHFYFFEQNLKEHVPDLEIDILYVLGTNALRESYYTAAQYHFEKIMDRFTENKNKTPLLYHTLSNLSLCYSYLKDSSKANAMNKTCWNADEKDLRPYNKYYLLLNNALIFSQELRPDQAIKALKQASDLIAKYNSCSFFYHTSTRYLVEFLIGSDLLQAAAEHMMELNAIEKCNLNIDKFNLGFMTFKTKGEFHFARYKKEGSVKDLLTALAMYDQQISFFDKSMMKNELHFADLIHENIGKRIEVLNELFEQSGNRSYKERVFELLQEAKNRSLSVGTQKFFLNRVEDEKIKSLLQKVNDFARILPPSDDIYNQLYKELHVRQLQPVKVDSKRPAISYDLCQEKLQKDSIVVVDTYQNYSHLWLYISNGQRDTLLRLRTDVLRNNFDNQQLPLFSSPDVEVPHALMEFIQEKMHNTLEEFEFENVVILGDGVLLDLPLDMVKQERSFSFSYHYNWEGVLKIERKVQTVDEISLFSYSDRKTIVSTTQAPYPDLPYGYEECIATSRFFESGTVKLISGNQLTKKRILGYKDSDILHFSTHAQGDPNNRLNNFLVTRDEASTFYTYDLSKTNFTSSLVVLSACETGSGKYIPGEGVFSISRDFYQAGVPTIVKTLWKVNDRSTATIMEHFYAHLKNGQNVTWALTNAKQDYLKIAPEKRRHPYFWAGIVVEGNPYLSFDFEK